jgi:oligopeptide transport system substrate-binding protein
VKKNPNYWRKAEGLPYLDEIDFRVVADELTAANAFKAGELDVLIANNGQVIKDFKDDKKYTYRAQDKYVDTFYQLMNVGQEGSPLADQNVRCGLTAATDNKTLADVIGAGQFPVANGPFSPGQQGYLDDPGNQKYDPAKAKQLIKEGGGVPGNKISIQFNADGGHKEWVEAVCNSITKAVGVACTGDSKADFQADLNARDAHEVKSLYRSGWVLDYPFNANFIRDLYGTKSDGNQGAFSSKAVDDLIAKADSAKSLEESEKLYQSIEKQLPNYMPSIPLWYYKVNAGYSDKVSGVEYAQDGDPILTGVQVKK